MGNETSQRQQDLPKSIDNSIKASWKKSTSKSSFAKRAGQAACAVGSKLYIFGGENICGGSLDDRNDLLTFDVPTNIWTDKAQTGDIPPSRNGATMVAVNDQIYLFGGLSRSTGWFSDVHKLNTNTCTWTKLAPEGTGPSARDKLACAAIGTKIYLFGGFGPKIADPEPQLEAEDDDEYGEDCIEEIENQDGVEFGWCNDLFIFDTATEPESWSQPMQLNLGVPTPRAAHVMCAIDKHLVIFGGRDVEARRNDIYMFDTETRKWVIDFDKNVRGRKPEPRSFHTAVAVGDKMVVIGGRGIENQHFNDVHICDIKKGMWLQPTIEGDKFTGRGLLSAALVGDEIVVFGGSSDFNPETMQCATYFNDVFTINTCNIDSGEVCSDKENITDNIPTPSSPTSVKTQSDSPMGTAA